MQPYFPEAFDRLCWILDTDGQYDASIAAGREAVRLNPKNGNAHDNIADDYLHKKDYDAVVRESQEALAINSGDPCGHENLGEAYIAQGRKADAHAEWQQVLQMDQGRYADAARKMLAKYP